MFNEKTWKNGEKIAQEYMRKNGYKIILTNFCCVGVELDIVAVLSKRANRKNIRKSFKDKIKYADSNEKKLLKTSMRSCLKTAENLLIITEVKARVTNKYGIGAEAITPYKKHNIIRGAEYIKQTKNLQNYQIRFDVASVDDGKIEYIENAF